MLDRIAKRFADEPSSVPRLRELGDAAVAVTELPADVRLQSAQDRFWEALQNVPSDDVVWNDAAREVGEALGFSPTALRRSPRRTPST